MSSSQERVEERMDDSSYIPDYVKQHEEALHKLREKAEALDFTGNWVIIGDDDYTDKRLQYATTSFKESEVSPRIILYAANEDDVQKGIHLSRDLGMSIAVRTGGHQYCGYSSTSSINMQIDLSKTFREYDYDSEKNILRCGVSHGLGKWAKLNNANGIYLPMGVCAFVHLGGHVHTGGWGMVARSHGLLADHVLSFEIILASGEQKTIIRPVDGETDQFNDDLYYAVLGGSKGGDFGIVTHWTFEPIRNADHPNAACYEFAWIWSERKMEAATRLMAEHTKRCASGEIPSDYEFLMNILGAGKTNLISNELKTVLGDRDFLDDGVVIPPVIVMWMCYTNKDGEEVAFDDQWFEAFAEALGEPIYAQRLTHTPISQGLAEVYIMKQDREMEYPFVKRSRVTLDMPDHFPEVYTDQMDKIMGWLGTRRGLHLVSQHQIYAGGAVGENGKKGLTAYAWRDLEYSFSHDAFYSVSIFGSARERAEEWQEENDQAFVGSGGYADKDMRMFAYTFGNSNLEEVWQYFYDNEDVYNRLRRIKGVVDPDGLFSAGPFSIKPL